MKNLVKGGSVLTRIRVHVEIVTPNSEASPDIPKRGRMLKDGDRTKLSRILNEKV